MKLAFGYLALLRTNSYLSGPHGASGLKVLSATAQWCCFWLCYLYFLLHLHFKPTAIQTGSLLHQTKERITEDQRPRMGMARYLGAILALLTLLASGTFSSPSAPPSQLSGHLLTTGMVNEPNRSYNLRRLSQMLMPYFSMVTDNHQLALGAHLDKSRPLKSTLHSHWCVQWTRKRSWMKKKKTRKVSIRVSRTLKCWRRRRRRNATMATYGLDATLDRTMAIFALVRTLSFQKGRWM